MSPNNNQGNELDEFGWDVEDYFKAEPGSTPDGLKEVAGLSGFEEVSEEEEKTDFFDEEEASEEEKPEPEKSEEEEETSEEETSEEETSEEEPEEEEEKSSGGYLEFAKKLQEAGTIPKDEDLDGLSEDEILDLTDKALEVKVDSQLEEIIEGWKEGLGDKGKEFIQFTMAGGKPEEFFSTYAKASMSQFDIQDEEGQKQWLRHYFKEYEELDSDEVVDRLQYLEDTEKLEAYSQRTMDKAKKEAEKTAEAELAKKQAAYQAAKEKRDNLKKTVKGKIREMKEIGGFSLKTLEKRKIEDFLFSNTVKTETGYITPFADKFRKIVDEDPEKLVLLGKLMMDDFDFSELVEKGRNEANTDTKKKIQRAKNEKKPKTKNPTQQAKAVWDLF